jgi:hypothetical protein
MIVRAIFVCSPGLHREGHTSDSIRVDHKKNPEQHRLAPRHSGQFVGKRDYFTFIPVELPCAPISLTTCTAPVGFTSVSPPGPVCSAPETTVGFNTGSEMPVAALSWLSSFGAVRAASVMIVLACAFASVTVGLLGN